MAKVGELSASKITTYFGCPLAYFLKYVMHEKVPTGAQLAFGKSIHYMLEKFYDINYKSDESFAKFWKFYWFSQVSGDFLKGKEKKNLITIEYKLKNGFKFKIGNHVKFFNNPVGEFFGYMRLGENILKRFYNRHKEKPKPIDYEKDVRIELFGHKVRGIIDRIDKMNGDYFLADYKTDKKAPDANSFTLHRHPQFTLYSKIFREVFNEKEKAILYYHLRSGKVLKTHRSQRDYDYLHKLMDDAQRRIESDDFTPFYGFHCNFCDYQVPCEKYSIDHGGPRIDKEGGLGREIKPAEEFLDWHTQEEREEWMEMAEER